MELIRIGVVSVLVLFICSIIGTFHSSLFFLSSSQSYLPEYDFIIIGAGTGGSTVAHTLITSLNATVLLIEAGGEMGLTSKVPFFCTLLQGTTFDWGFNSVPQFHSSFGFVNHQQKLPRGKGLGGSAQINYMLHSLGKPSDFDNWRDSFGLDKWSYSNFSCHLENVNCPEGADEQALPTIADLDIHEARLGFYLKRAEMEFRKDGLDAIHLNTAQFTIRDGKRWSVFNEFLQPIIGHPNLHILPDTLVSRIVLVGNSSAGKQAIGVRLNRDQFGFIRARKEVILSAGAYQSPQLLMLSGVGRAEDLSPLKIPVLVESPSVGQNLFDHMNVPLYVSIAKPLSVTKSKILSLSELLKYFLTGKGIFATSAMIGTGSKRNSSAGILLFGVGSIDEFSLRKVSNLDYETFKSMFPLHLNSSQEGFVLLSTCHHPASRGSISLRTSAVEDAPQIDPQYFADPKDIQCTKEALRLALQLVESETFERIGAKIIWPELPQCIEFNLQDQFDDYLECLIRTIAMTGHHPGGTCALGSVVDEDLRVYGVNNLRIIDGSVFPAPITGFPNSIIRSFAKRAAQFIVAQYSNDD